MNLIIKEIYLNEILSGKKTIEYRNYNSYYISRLSQPIDRITFRAGYHKSAKTATFEVLKVELTTQFEIHLGKQLG